MGEFFFPDGGAAGYCLRVRTISDMHSTSIVHSFISTSITELESTKLRKSHDWIFESTSVKRLTLIPCVWYYQRLWYLTPGNRVYILGPSVSGHESNALTSSFFCIYGSTYGTNRLACILLIIRLSFVSPNRCNYIILMLLRKVSPLYNPPHDESYTHRYSRWHRTPINHRRRRLQSRSSLF